MQGIQAQAVAGVGAVLFVAGPGDDVAGDQQLLHGQAGDAALFVELRQDHLAEEVLVDAGLDHGVARPARRDGGDVVPRQDLFAQARVFHLAVIGHAVPVLEELVPDLAVKPAEVRCAPASQRGVDGGEVGQFQADGPRCPAEHRGQLDDFRVSHVDAPERRAAIQADCQQQFVPGPCLAFRCRHAPHYTRPGYGGQCSGPNGEAVKTSLDICQGKTLGIKSLLSVMGCGGLFLSVITFISFRRAFCEHPTW